MHPRQYLFHAKLEGHQACTKAYQQNKNYLYYNENHDYMMFTNHKGLFIYNDETYLYLGVNLSWKTGSQLKLPNDFNFNICFHFCQRNLYLILAYCNQ